MKKIILPITIVAALAMACHKERTCTCDVTSTPKTTGTASTAKITTKSDHVTKHEGAALCHSTKYTSLSTVVAGTVVNTYTFDVVSDCKLK